MKMQCQHLEGCVSLHDSIFLVSSQFLGNEYSLWKDRNLTFLPLHDHAGLREVN